MEGFDRYSYASVHLEPQEQIGLHRQPSWELSYVITGSGMRLIGNTTEPFESGEVVLIPPDIPHCWYFDFNTVDSRGRIANITVTFTTPFINELEHLFPELTEEMESLKSRHDAVKMKGKTASHLIDIMLSMRDMSAAERVTPLIRMMQLLSQHHDEKVIGRYCKINKEDERLNQIKTFSICNYKRKIMLGDIARHVGMNTSSFCVFFKKATGTTYTSYLNDLRLEMACRLLKDTDTPVAEICYEVGFNDVPYFNRFFKKQKGLSPNAYRKKGPSA
jgi:AraC-like DNA-binding protein